MTPEETILSIACIILGVLSLKFSNSEFAESLPSNLWRAIVQRFEGTPPAPSQDQPIPCADEKPAELSFEEICQIPIPCFNPLQDIPPERFSWEVRNLDPWTIWPLQVPKKEREDDVSPTSSPPVSVAAPAAAASTTVARPKTVTFEESVLVEGDGAVHVQPLKSALSPPHQQQQPQQQSSPVRGPVTSPLERLQCALAESSGSLFGDRLLLSREPETPVTGFPGLQAIHPPVRSGELPVPSQAAPLPAVALGPPVVPDLKVLRAFTAVRRRAPAKYNGGFVVPAKSRGRRMAPPLSRPVRGSVKYGDLETGPCSLPTAHSVTEGVVCTPKGGERPSDEWAASQEAPVAEMLTMAQEESRGLLGAKRTASLKAAAEDAQASIAEASAPVSESASKKRRSEVDAETSVAAQAAAKNENPLFALGPRKAQNQIKAWIAEVIGDFRTFPSYIRPEHFESQKRRDLCKKVYTLFRHMHEYASDSVGKWDTAKIPPAALKDLGIKQGEYRAMLRKKLRAGSRDVKIGCFAEAYNAFLDFDDLFPEPEL